MIEPIPRIRRATRDDTAEIARLLSDLGHPTTAEDVAGSWESWAATGNSALVASAAEADGLVGLATLHQMLVLHRRAPVGRITALIVDCRVRGQGIGRALVEAAEEVFRKRGCGLVEITSNDRLAEAHSFYERIGYKRTSIRVAKRLMAAV